MNRCRVTVASNMSEETYRYICDSFVKKFGETEFTKLVDDSILGGFILGLGEILIVAFFPQFSGYRDAFAFLMLIWILFYKPTGLLGEKTTEKV